LQNHPAVRPQGEASSRSIVTERVELVEVLVVIYVIFCILVGLCGSNRRLGFFLTFLASLLISPVIVLIILMVTGTNRS
jgi:hypothetical protein